MTFITVIGGIGRVERPIVGTLLFFASIQRLADLGGIYLMTLGEIAILVMLCAPKGLWRLSRRPLRVAGVAIGKAARGRTGPSGCLTNDNRHIIIVFIIHYR